MKFIQIMEFQASQLDEIRALDRQWREKTTGRRTATAMTITQDRERPDTYVWMIEFPSYEDAMRNNDLPETQEIAREMAKLTGGPATFRNLDVLEQANL